MADVKISELPTTTDVSTGDYIPVVEGGVTKKVQAGPGGGLDADKVGGLYPIYVMPISTIPSADLAGMPSPSVYHGHVNNVAGYPELYGSIIGFSWSAGGRLYDWQIFYSGYNLNHATYFRCEIAPNVWGDWQRIWTGLDTGGQPPATRPSGAGSNVCGESQSIDVASGANVVAPSTGTTWYGEIQTYGCTTGGGNLCKTFTAAAGATVGTMAGGNGRVKWYRLA